MQDDHCQKLVREADKDRFLAALFAPAERRAALFALYAFNVEIARVREVAREPMPGEIRLQWWRDVLGGERAGEAKAHPVASALLGTIERHGLAREPLLALIEARSFDLYDEPMAGLGELEGYARKTNSALIECAARILGNAQNSIADLAGHAGIAHATAGLLLAFPLHASRRQLFVPLETLTRYGAKPEDIFVGKATVELRSALAELRLRARRHLAAAGELIAAAPDIVLPALLPLALVRPMLDFMERSAYDPFKPDELPQWRRQWLMWRASKWRRRIAG
ncbi:MAG: phytoene/squalene synthase family protein [Hyphomicrobiales bacterium]